MPASMLMIAALLFGPQTAYDHLVAVLIRTHAVAGCEVSATGLGRAPPRLRASCAKLMARRAAEVRAMHNLARKIRLTPGDFLRGFRYRSVRRIDDDWIEARVTVFLPN